MANIQQDLKNHEITWSRFIKYCFWSAGTIAVILLLMWIFLV